MYSLTVAAIVIFVLIVVNGVLAMSEMAIVSSRKSRLQQWANLGDRKALKALGLADAPGHFLSTVQVGITLVGILTGAFGGAALADKLAAWLAQFPIIAPYRHVLALGLVVIGITYLSLIIGELAPKRLALVRPERVSRIVAGPMGLFAKIVYPVVWTLSVSTDGILHLLGIKHVQRSPVSEEELKIILEQGTEAGMFEAVERDMMNSVLRLGNRKAADIMTTRGELTWLNLEDPPEAIRRTLGDSSHNRLPVGRGSLDNVIGVVQAKDILLRMLHGQSLDLKALLKPPLFVPESTPAFKLLELIKVHPVHMAIVVDEYGALQGVVSLNDILEAIVGDIPMPGEPVDLEAVQREDGSWLLDGLLPVDELKDVLHIHKLPGEDKGYFHTLGGFVMMQIGRIPVTADRFEWQGLRFEVVDMDGHRVDKVLVSAVPQDESDTGS